MRRAICFLTLGLFLAGLMQIWMPSLHADEAQDAVKEAVETVAGAAEEVEKVAEEAAEEAAPEEPNPYKATWWALLPPIVAILLALITKEVYSSLFIGIVLGAGLAAKFKFLAMMDHVVNDGLISAISDTAGIFLFLVILGILVAMINKSGAAQAFGDWAKTHVKSRVGAILSAFLLGILIFIDDYFNCLTVGSVMCPVTDSHRISRAKLAFIVDATAAPICMIAPISSWAAAVAEYTKGTGCDGLQLFIKAIPFNFYSLLTLIFIVVLTLMKFDFGPMALHEKNAIENGDLFTKGGEKQAGEQPVANPNGSLWDLILPVIVLIVICVFALLYVGGFGGDTDFITAFGDTDATVGLPWGGLLALVLAMIYFLFRRVISFKEIMECVPKGFIAMVPAMMILTFAASLKNMTNLLEIKTFIKTVVENSSQHGMGFLPALIFLLGALISFATGTSWGTFGILIPIVANIFEPTDPLFIISVSACLAGSVCGDHCSPISDTTIMSSAGARCEHINHVSTQLPYAITVAFISCIGYLLAGFIKNWYVVFPLTVFLLIVIMIFMKKGRVVYTIPDTTKGA